MAMRDSGRLVAPASRRWRACPKPGSARHRRDAGATWSSDHWSVPRITHSHLERPAVRQGGAFGDDDDSVADHGVLGFLGRVESVAVDDLHVATDAAVFVDDGAVDPCALSH